MRCQRPALVQNQFLSQIPTFCMVVNLIDLRLWLKFFIFHRCLDYILSKLTLACRKLFTSTQSGATLLKYRVQSDQASSNLYRYRRLIQRARAFGRSKFNGGKETGEGELARSMKIDHGTFFVLL